MTDKEKDNYFKKQYLQYGGFCGTCGEGVSPILNEDIDIFGLCPFGGKHPKKVEGKEAKGLLGVRHETL